MSQRRDGRGRRIGYNWWREHITTALSYATDAWEREAEQATSLYATELAEYEAENPRPNLKDFLIRNAGMWRPMV